MSKYTIVVPVIGDSSDNHAINLAKLMAQQNKGQVFIFHVIEVGRHLPLDADLTPDFNVGEPTAEARVKGILANKTSGLGSIPVIYGKRKVIYQ